MALRDQPYIPLYVQDVLTDEKLVECSPHAHGVYFLLLCILHKQEKYGTLCLKQKYKQNGNKISMFANMLTKQMPFSKEEIESGLTELLDENVINIDGYNIIQKRMVYDGEISLIRAKVGKTGGSSVTKQYGKSGFLYLMSDNDTKHKIGISVNPQNRLYRLRSDLKLGKDFMIIMEIPVEDMGFSEDLAHKHFGEKMDGEWVVGSLKEVQELFVSLQAKLQAKSQANSEYEIENENENEIESILNLISSEIPEATGSNQVTTPILFSKLDSFISEYPTFQDIEIWKQYLAKIRESDFLMGRGDEVKQPALAVSWICDPKNAMDVMDGKYKNRAKRRAGNAILI